VEQKSKLANVNGWFESSGHDGQLHHDIENTAFRIVQEAVTNILRHAKCQNIWVKIDRQQDQVYLSIRDDGKGFDIERARSNAISGTSFGLLNMEERAVLVGGSMDITGARRKDGNRHAPAGRPYREENVNADPNHAGRRPRAGAQRHQGAADRHAWGRGGGRGVRWRRSHRDDPQLKPDLVLLDIAMKGMNGLEACAACAATIRPSVS
jgi:CheY-like chemotaxis protein